MVFSFRSKLVAPLTQMDNFFLMDAELASPSYLGEPALESYVWPPQWSCRCMVKLLLDGRELMIEHVHLLSQFPASMTLVKGRLDMFPLKRIDACP